MHFTIQSSPSGSSNSYLSNSINKLCSQCNSECLTCSGGTRTECLSCDTSNLSYKLYWSVSKTCTSTCPEGSFLVDSEANCSTCHQTCSSCSGGSEKNNCNSCTSSGDFPYYDAATRTCSQSCPFGSFLSDQINRICSKCRHTTLLYTHY